MKMQQRSACPLCGRTDFTSFRRGTVRADDLRPADFRITDKRYGSCWNFSRCRTCGFVFSNPYVPAAELLSFYQELDDREYGSEAQGREKNFAIILRRLAKLGFRNGRLLDIGAASGIFMNLARRAGFTVTGIEPSRQLAQEAAERYDVHPYCGTAESYIAVERFDVVTLLDILEHLENPDSFMARVAELTTPGGMVVIVTPDIDSLAARLFGRRWWHYRTAHVNFFTLRSIEALLLRHGFAVRQRRRYAWHFSMAYLWTRLLPAPPAALQNLLKRVHLPLQLLDSWEIYAEKRND